eukprot:scaffold12878_cov51-Phaeocystis_antarctica.AAC.1
MASRVSMGGIGSTSEQWPHVGGDEWQDERGEVGTLISREAQRPGSHVPCGLGVGRAVGGGQGGGGERRRVGGARDGSAHVQRHRSLTRGRVWHLHHAQVGLAYARATGQVGAGEASKLQPDDRRVPQHETRVEGRAAQRGIACDRVERGLARGAQLEGGHPGRVSEVADAAVTAHGAPQTVTRLELTDENPRPLITRSAPPATPTEVGDRPLTARAAPVSCCVPVRAELPRACGPAPVGAVQGNRLQPPHRRCERALERGVTHATEARARRVAHLDHRCAAEAAAAQGHGPAATSRIIGGPHSGGEGRGGGGAVRVGARRAPSYACRADAAHAQHDGVRGRRGVASRDTGDLRVASRGDAASHAVHHDCDVARQQAQPVAGEGERGAAAERAAGGSDGGEAHAVAHCGGGECGGGAVAGDTHAYGMRREGVVTCCGAGAHGTGGCRVGAVLRCADHYARLASHGDGVVRCGRGEAVTVQRERVSRVGGGGRAVREHWRHPQLVVEAAAPRHEAGEGGAASDGHRLLTRLERSGRRRRR